MSLFQSSRLGAGPSPLGLRFKDNFFIICLFTIKSSVSLLCFVPHNKGVTVIIKQNVNHKIQSEYCSGNTASSLVLTLVLPNLLFKIPKLA